MCKGERNESIWFSNLILNDCLLCIRIKIYLYKREGESTLTRHSEEMKIKLQADAYKMFDDCEIDICELGIMLKEAEKIAWLPWYYSL